MAGEKREGRVRTILQPLLGYLILPGLGAGLAVGFATGHYGVSSFATGLFIALGMWLFWELDRLVLQQRLQRLPEDWPRFALGQTFSIFGHIAGAALGLLVGSRVFGFAISPTLAWYAVGGILIGFPIIHGTGDALRFHRQLREKERLEERLRTLAAEAELKALKAQVDPHFLFNTLNTIAALIHTDPDRAEATIERLAEMFRYVLNGSEQRVVPLRDELSFLDGYLRIEHARFGERLQVTREVAAQALDVPVPSLLLQPLVENAVRHGRGSDGRVDVTIRVDACEGEVRISIADQGPGIPPGFRLQESRGVGLQNVDDRLRKTYGEEYGLEIAANEPKGAMVSVRIPLGGGEV